MKSGIQDQLLRKIREIRTRLTEFDRDALPESSYVFLRSVSLSEEKLPIGINAAKMSVVKKICGFHKTKMAKIAAKLENQGYIVKINADFDKRAKYVELTTQGRERLEKEGKIVTDLADSLMNKLGDTETLHLIGLLDKFSEVLASSVKADNK